MRIDLWVIGLYLLSMLVVALRVSSGSRDVEGYTVGNRNMPGWAIGLSVLGTFLSSITFLSYPAKTYRGNWNVYVFGLALPVAAFVAVRYFIPLYRNGTRLSAYELLEERFGYWARLYAMLSYCLLQLIRVGTVQLLVAFALAPLLDWQADPDTKITSIIILVGVAVVIYDTLGGMKAVVWTDVMQVIILLVGALWCLALLLPGTSGELWALFTHGGEENKFSLGEMIVSQQPEMSFWEWIVANLGRATVLVTLIYGLSENLRNYGTDQNYVQRMLAAESDSAAKRSFWFAALSYLPLSMIFCLIGTSLYVHYQIHPDLLPAGILPEQVFPHFIHNELPPVVAGLVIAAIMAAAMSSIDSSLNSSSTVILVDFFRRLRKGEPRIPEIITLRATTIILGLAATGLSIWLFRIYGQDKSRNLLDLWWQYAGTAGGGMFGLFLLAWWTPRLPAWCAGVALSVCIMVLAWGSLARDLGPPQEWLECVLHPNLVGVSGTVVMVLLGFSFSLAVRLGWIRGKPVGDIQRKEP